MRVSIDGDVCTSCGLCVETCADIFEMHDESAVAKVEEVPGEFEEAVSEAAQNCPVEAISISD